MWLNTTFDGDLPDTKVGVAILNAAKDLGYTLEYQRMTWDSYGVEVPGHVIAKPIRR
jgi:hypothetical protein